MINWLLKNKEWLFSGAGLIAITGLFKFFQKRSHASVSPTAVSYEAPNNVGAKGVSLEPSGQNYEINIDELKAKTHILFIDDDAKFKVVDILSKSGWLHTRRISDISGLDDEKIQRANIFFIDIQGVGKKLKFRDEGLGLAKALKDRFPNKKVVIYSAQTYGERFHDALRKADDFLAKNADPYEFQQLAERLAREIAHTL